MVKKTSFQSVQPLTDPAYEELDEIGRCIHFDDFKETLQKGFLVPQPLKNSHAQLSQKVLWFAPCQSMSAHNYYGNVTFVINWETVLQTLGLGDFYLIDQLICNSRSFTRVVFTSNHYTNLRRVNFDFEGSPIKRSENGFLHVTQCFNKQRHGPHELQVAIEVTPAQSRWLLEACTRKANDHSLANTLFTGNSSRKKGTNSKYESYKCYKYNTQNKECPYEFTSDECEDWIQTVVQSTSNPSRLSRTRRRSKSRGRNTGTSGHDYQWGPRAVAYGNDSDDNATEDCPAYDHDPDEVVPWEPVSTPTARTRPRSSPDEADGEDDTVCQCVIL